jgi:DNA topoisomerase-1
MFSTDPVESAAEAGLRYVRSGGPCIQRLKHGKSFRYIGPDGKSLRDPVQLQRIRALAIPPAWTNLWICPSPNGHLQAVGRDAKGRKQYRYHPRYRSVRDEAKFSRMIAFSAALALIRRGVEHDLTRRGLPREKVVAVVVRLLETAYVRIGNDEYAKENESFGLTTMRSRHVRIDGSKLMFQFRGKSGQEHTIELTDRRLASIVKQCRDLPGYNLFEYIDEAGNICRIDSADVNRYIRDLAGQDFTAKDFRTWAGTLLAARELHAAGPAQTQSEEKKIVIDAVKQVAKRLGNRPATCRKYYIHPAILDAYSDGSLFERMRDGEAQDQAFQGTGLRPEEYAAVTIIAKYQEHGPMARDTRTEVLRRAS